MSKYRFLDLSRDVGQAYVTAIGAIIIVDFCASLVSKAYRKAKEFKATEEKKVTTTEEKPAA